MLKIGLLSTLVGPYQKPGEDGIRGAKMALRENNDHAGKQPIDLQVIGTNAIASRTADALKQLWADGVRVFVGPLSGDEAIAVREFANAHPDGIFVNGAAASQPMFNPAPNFFMFNATGAQMITGLGQYAYNTLGYRKVVTIGEAYSYPFAQIGGFALDFINNGGQVLDYIWCGLGTRDFTTYIHNMPEDVDAVFTSMGGTDGIHFLEQFRALRGDTPLIGGSIVGDQSLLNEVGEYADILEGVISASVFSDNIATEAGQTFIQTYRATYPEEGFYAPSFFAYTYYVNMKALLRSLDAVQCDLKILPYKLQMQRFEMPGGTVHLDEHRVGVVDTFINEIRRTDSGQLYTHMLQRIPQTRSNLGLDDATFLKTANFSMRHMPGKKEDTFEDIIRRAKEKKDQNQL